MAAIADELYAVSPGDFTEQRNSVAKACADKELGKRVKALKKPSVAAWAINVLVRHEHEQIDQVLGLGQALRTAAESLDGEELRALTRQRRQLTHALASTARSLARDQGIRLTGTVADQVEGTLNAAMLDPAVADAVRTGLLVGALAATGLGDTDVGAALAVPGAVGARATPVVPQPTGLHLVPDDALRLDEARELVEEAERRVTEHRADLAQVDRSLADLGARRLQLRGEIDELSRRIAGIEDEVEGVDEDITEAGEARDDAEAEVTAAEADLEQARTDLGRLERG